MIVSIIQGYKYKNVTARQEEATLKRIKLEYDDIGSMKQLDIWDTILESNEGLDMTEKYNALKNGNFYIHLL